MTLKILIAQINVTVGAIENNTKKIIDIIQEHQATHDVIMFPELCITGYPPEDLLLRPEFHLQVTKSLDLLKSIVKDCYVIVGYPRYSNNLNCYNTAGVITNGSLLTEYYKQCLPNYGVFDEQRYFKAGDPVACIFTVKNYKLGICICQDLWDGYPVDQLLTAGVDGILCINASPFEQSKQSQRESLLEKYSKTGVFISYVNLVGGQDELVFDGQSCIYDSLGKMCGKLEAFVEQNQTVVINDQEICSQIAPTLSDDELLYKALVCGLRDYVEKNHISGVVLGLSGGIDSAVTLAIAVEALGASRVHVVMMPSRFTASMSVEDATLQAQILNVQYTMISIEPLFHTFIQSLAPGLDLTQTGIMEENLQARIRGALLMAHSNKTGYMLLTTSNKSELAVGYATIYGDMAGGFSVLKDVLKTQVYDLAKFINKIKPVIPERVITRAPSAELAENQTDQDTLPEYYILDAIIRLYVEDNLSSSEIINRGYVAHDVISTIRRIKHNEYKRRQAAPGVKISSRAFGKDWRYPLTNG